MKKSINPSLKNNFFTFYTQIAMMTQLKTVFTLFLLFASALLFAQTQKKTIAVGNSSNPANLPPGDVAMYEGTALTGFRQTNLCITLERAEWEKILKERGIQKTEEFLDGKIAQQGVSLGADYLLILSLQSLEASDKKQKDFVTGAMNRKVDATLILGANVISVETGQVKHNKTITLKKNDSWNSDNAMYNASKEDVLNSFKESFVKDCAWEFSLFAFEVFPPEIVVVRVEETGKKGKTASKVLCKTSAKLPDGIKLDVFTEKIVDLGDGDTDVQKIKIGQMKVGKVDSEKSVICEVKDGGEEILNLVNNNTKLKCTPNFEGGMFDDLNPFKKKPGY